VFPFGLRPGESRSDALAHADRLDVRNRREDPDDHIAERAEGREVRLAEADEIDSGGTEPMENVDGVLDTGPCESVQGPEDRDIKPPLVRVQEQGLEAARRGIRYAFDTTEGFRLLSSAFAWTSTFLDRVAPGTLQTLTASWVKRTKDDSRALLRELAKASGEPEDRIEDAIKKGLEVGQRHQKAGRKLFDVLPPHERERVAREFRDLIMLSASWCAVVR